MHSWLSASGINLLVFDTVTVFAAGLLFALLARRLRQSLLLGYLVAGLVIGPMRSAWSTRRLIFVFSLRSVLSC